MKGERKEGIVYIRSEIMLRHGDVELIMWKWYLEVTCLIQKEREREITNLV